MDTWGALTSNVMSRDDLSIRRKTGIVSLLFNTKYCEFYSNRQIIKSHSNYKSNFNRKTDDAFKQREI